MRDLNDRNRRNIEDFRANGGKLGGGFSAQLYPQFGEYQQKTTRQIPVVILEPAG